MIFGEVFRVIGSKVEQSWFLAVFGQKAWTNPLGIWSKFQICSNFLHRLKEPRNDVWSGF